MRWQVLSTKANGYRFARGGGWVVVRLSDSHLSQIPQKWEFCALCDLYLYFYEKNYTVRIHKELVLAFCLLIVLWLAFLMNNLDL